MEAAEGDTVAAAEEDTVPPVLTVEATVATAGGLRIIEELEREARRRAECEWMDIGMGSLGVLEGPLLALWKCVPDRVRGSIVSDNINKQLHDGPLDIYLRARDCAIVEWAYVMDEEKGFIKDNTLTFNLKFSLSNIVGFRKLRTFTDPDEPAHDIALIIEGEKIYVSKPFLSLHSPVFHTMFYGDFVEKNKTEIELKDVHLKEFIELLHVIYPPYKTITRFNYKQLLKLGDRFEIDVVTKQCERALIDSTPPETYIVPTLLHSAGCYRLPKLQSHCLALLKTLKDVTDLKNTDQFKEFTEEIQAALNRKIVELSE